MDTRECSTTARVALLPTGVEVVLLADRGFADSKLMKYLKETLHWHFRIRIKQSFAFQGQTPVVSATGQRFRCNLISMLISQGTLYFKLFTQNFGTEVMLNFLRRLIRQIPQKVFLIVDKHPVHLSSKLNRWLERHSDRIRMFLLPSYSPELNPDKLLDHDIEANAVRRKRAKTKSEMMENVHRHLHRRQRQPNVVQRFFQEERVFYAAH